jgi:hypothetical protein
MSVSSYGGVNTSVTGFTDGYVYSTGVPLPNGRNVALDGHTWAYNTKLRTSLAGRGGTRTMSYGIDGKTGVGPFSDSAQSSAVLTSQNGCAFLAEGGTGTFRITSDGSFYFGRGGSGNTHDNNGLDRTDGALYVEFTYGSVPTAPTAPAVSPSGATGATVSWSAPADNGDLAITGYRLQYSTDLTFATGVTSVEVGNVGTYTIPSGLTGGATYYFRLQAENAATAAAATWSQSSSSVSLVIGTAPSAPTGAAATAFAGRLEVDWVSPGGTITSYTVELSTDNFATVLSTFALLDPTKTTKTITGLTPGTLYYARVKAVNTIGTSAASATVSATVPTRTALGLVRGASAHTLDGYQIELRSDGASTPTITLGYTPMGAASTFTSIANVPIDATAANHAAPGGARNLALVLDPSGNIYIVGRRGDDGSTVLVKRYARTAPTVWSAPTSLSQALPSTGDSLIEFAGQYVAGSGGSPIPSIMLLARRAGTLAAGSLSYALIDPAAVAAGTGTMFFASGSDPAFMGAAPTTGANTGHVDVALLQRGGTRLALLGNSWGVVDVVNGVITGVVKAADGANIVGTSPWARILGVSATAFAVFTVSAGALAWSFYSTSGSSLGSSTLAGAGAFGGSFTDQWDTYTDVVSNVVTAYFVDSTAGARSLSFVDVSPATYAATASSVLTAAFGAASSTNGAVRVPQGPVDERRVMVTAANLLTGTKSTAAYVDTTGNLAPNAPVLVLITGFDATQSKDLAWTVSDSNPLDTETAYEVQVQRVSDNVNVVATGAVASSATAYTMGANTLVNATAYRWRARTTDALGNVGAWSAYSNLNPTAIGTLTITSPTPDNVAGVNTSSVPIVWTYTQVNGYTQTQRRVLVIRVSDASVLLDTTMQASTVGNYTVVGMLSDVQYSVQVSIITNAPGTPTVTTTRLVTPSFASPDVPTLTLTPSGSKIIVTVTNPTPTGSRPAVLSNGVYRRASGTTDAFVRVAVIVANGTYNDHAVASGKSYDYQIVASANATPVTTASSDIAVGIAPLLMGVWIYDPLTPDASEVNYLYTKTRTEQTAIASAKTQLQGRTNPLIEFGTPAERSVSVAIRIPIDASHDAAVEYLRNLYLNRRAFVYRDNRSRIVFGALADAPGITDAADGGSEVTLKVTRIDYSEAV